MNRLLGQFNLEGIPPAPRGVPQVEVKFDLDANGILNVSAKDLGTGTEQTVRIEQSSGLSEDQIKQMQRDAEEHAEEDRKWRELADERNKAESMCFQLEKVIKDNDEKLSDADKAAVNQAIEKVREKAKGEDREAIKSAMEELEQASHALSKTLYESGAAAAGAAGDADGARRSLSLALTPRPTMTRSMSISRSRRTNEAGPRADLSLCRTVVPTVHIAQSAEAPQHWKRAIR